MNNPNTSLLPNIEAFIASISVNQVSGERKAVLQPLINYIQVKYENNEAIKLNFICTHNSRRSQLTQAWAKAMAVHFGIHNRKFFGWRRSNRI